VTDVFFSRRPINHGEGSKKIGACFHTSKRTAALPAITALTASRALEARVSGCEESCSRCWAALRRPAHPDDDAPGAAAGGVCVEESPLSRLMTDALRFEMQVAAPLLYCHKGGQRGVAHVLCAIGPGGSMVAVTVPPPTPRTQMPLREELHALRCGAAVTPQSRRHTVAAPLPRSNPQGPIVWPGRPSSPNPPCP
jgi:hypothetical protein